jgi:hypothetical protein
MGGSVKVEILLTGMVSGLTILLGVITADWLKRLRDRTEYTRHVVLDISMGIRNFTDYLAGHLLETWHFSNEVRMSEAERDFFETYYSLAKELRELSESPSWPQRNAKRIRETAVALRVCVIANQNHCGSYKVLLNQESAEELFLLEWELRSGSFSRQDARTAAILIPEKADDLKRKMLGLEEAPES